MTATVIVLISLYTHTPAAAAATVTDFFPFSCHDIQYEFATEMVASSLSIMPKRLFANLFLSILVCDVCVCVSSSQLNLHVFHVYATMFMHAIQFQLLITFVCLREIDKTQQYAINLEMHRSHTHGHTQALDKNRKVNLQVKRDHQ